MTPSQSIAPIDTADVVRHGPTGEEWLVARVNGDHLFPCGWPPTRADLKDCTLVKKATPEQREDLLQVLAAGKSEHAASAAATLRGMEKEGPSDADLLEVAREEAAIYADGATVLDLETMLRVLRSVARRFPAQATPHTDHPARSDMQSLIERIETRVGMGHGAWDMVRPEEIVSAVLAEAASVQGMGAQSESLTPDELYELISAMESLGHDKRSFEAECPACTAVRKLKAMRDGAAAAPAQSTPTKEKENGYDGHDE